MWNRLGGSKTYLYLINLDALTKDFLGSNNYGIAGMYSLKALDAGFLGLSFSNATPLVAPSRALEVIRAEMLDVIRA